MNITLFSFPVGIPFRRFLKSLWPFGSHYMSSFILCLSFPLSVSAASSPMVERHIFSPTHDGTGAYKSPMSLRLEKTLMFTGVVISSQGKWAIIRETGKTNEEKLSGMHKEGDEIMGMVIRKIGNNFLILAGEGKEVRLNLFQEGKSRPSLPAGSESPSVSAEDIPAATLDTSARSSSPSTGARSTSPHVQPSNPPTKIPEEKNQGPSSSPLPEQTQNPFLKDNPNPFLQDTLPDSEQVDLPDAEQ